MARLHLIVGPVGAGKSTFAVELRRQHGAVLFDLDQWMAVLYGDDERPAENVIDWYVERKSRCLEQIWRVAEQVVDRGVDVVLELGLIQRAAREAFYSRTEELGHDLIVYVVDASRDWRRQRVEERNRQRGVTFAMEVPPAIFEMASDMWEPPDGRECRERDVRFMPVPG